MATQKSLTELDVLKKEILASDFEEKNKISSQTLAEQTTKISEPDHRHPVSFVPIHPEGNYFPSKLHSMSLLIQHHLDFAIESIKVLFHFRSKWKLPTLKSLQANLSLIC